MLGRSRRHRRRLCPPAQRPLRQPQLARVILAGLTEHHGHCAAVREAVERLAEHGVRVDVGWDAGAGGVVLDGELVGEDVIVVFGDGPR